MIAVLMLSTQEDAGNFVYTYIIISESKEKNLTTLVSPPSITRPILGPPTLTPRPSRLLGLVTDLEQGDQERTFCHRYENDNSAARFTEQQLAEIRKSTLSKLLCDNFDIAGDIQRAAFDLPSNFL